MRIFREMLFDLKDMGVHSYVILLGPILFAAASWGICLQEELFQDKEFLIILFEILIPSLGGYGSVMLMQGILDTEGGEIVFSFHRPYLYWGILQQIRLLVLFSFLVAADSIVLSCLLGLPFRDIFQLGFCQCVAVMGLSFMGIAIFRKVSIGLVILVAFIGIQISLGQEYPVFNWIYELEEPAICLGQVGIKNIIAYIIGIFSFAYGQTWIRPD